MNLFNALLSKKGEEKPPSPHRRIHLMDELRGLAVLCMIFYHAFYTMAYLFDMELGRTLLFFFMPAEPFFAALFIVISGISSQFSHSNLARGAKLFVISLLLTAATLLFVPQEAIRFGILHFLSVNMMLFGLLKPLLDKVPTWVGLLSAAFFYTITFWVSSGVFGIPGLLSVPAPDLPFHLQFLFPSITHRGAYSADYFPLLPWSFIFLFGTFFGRIVRDKTWPAFVYRPHIKPLSFFGRWALVIYVVHQPVIYGVLWLITQIFHIG